MRHLWKLTDCRFLNPCSLAIETRPNPTKPGGEAQRKLANIPKLGARFDVPGEEALGTAPVALRKVIRVVAHPLPVKDTPAEKWESALGVRFSFSERSHSTGPAPFQQAAFSASRLDSLGSKRQSSGANLPELENRFAKRRLDCVPAPATIASFK